MSTSLSAKRDRLQRQVEELERSLSATHTELELLSSDTDEESDDDVTTEEAEQSAADLLALREKVQNEIQNLEMVLGEEDGPICISDDDDSSSEESELSLSVDSCLQMNLVYQQVVQETLDTLETLLTQNHRQQKELMSQLCGPIKEPSREQSPSSSYQQPINLYLGRLLKPYFKDKLTGLGPPANQETKEKSSRMTGCLDDKKLKVRRWESWQKTLLIHSVTRDSLRKLIQPKLSRVDYLTQKLSSAKETDREQLREQIDSLEKEIDLLKAKKEEELIGERYEEHDWQKISNIDFEGTRDADDIRRFWQNFLHPSINKTSWSQEEVQQLKDISKRHGERHWEAIAQELGTGRTAFMCLQTFQRFVSDSLKRKTWTPAEDALLRELVDKMRIGNFIPYTQMSYFMEGRDPAQLIYRWNQVLDPSLKRGPWTKQEDQLLLDAVSYYGEKKWWKIRLKVPGRTDSACRDRYLDCLKAGTKKGAFDKREQELLLQLVEKHGVGRWAKIAAEIPHRNDAHCLREWRKLSRRQLALDQKNETFAKKRIRKEMIKLEEESTEEEEMQVQYIDSDDEKVKKKDMGEVKITEELEEEYTIPPMEEWIPAEKSEHFTFLSFRPVVFPSSGDVPSGKEVRSTIVGKFGRSVIIGPRPRVLQWEEHHSSKSMMMVSPDQLRAYLRCKAHKFNNNRRVTDLGLRYELQAALTPWIGNLLIPAKPRLIMVDVLREQGEKTQLSSTPIFLLLLQTMNVDTIGCKNMIEQRRNKVVFLTPSPKPSSVQDKNPQTVAGMLQKRRAMKEGLLKVDLQHQQILKQLQDLQHQQKQQQLLVKQQVQPQQLILMQQPQPLLPQISPMSFAKAVFISQPVMQQQQHALNTSPVSPRRPAVGGVITSLIPAPSTPHRWTGCPASLTPTSSSLFCQQYTPLTHNLKVDLLPFTGSILPITSSNPPGSPSQLCSAPIPAKSTQNPPRGSEQMEAGEKDACISHDRLDFAGAKTMAPQEASEAKTEAKKKALSRPSAQSQRTHPALHQPVVPLPPQQLCFAFSPSSPRAAPSSPVKCHIVSQGPSPAGIISSSLTPAPSLRPNVPPVCAELPSISFHKATSSHCDREVSSTPNLSSASSPCLTDHDYTFLNPSPMPSCHISHGALPSPASTHPPSHPSKYQFRERKRKRVEEPQKVPDTEADQFVTGTDTGVDGAGRGVIQNGKRIRKLSQKAKDLQAATIAQAEAKKKKTTVYLHKKSSSKFHYQQEVQVPMQEVTKFPGLGFHPAQSVMTRGGLVQLAEAPPQCLQLVLVPTTPLPTLPDHISASPPVPLASIGCRALAPKASANFVLVTPPNQYKPSIRPSEPLPPRCVQQSVPHPVFSTIPSCLPQSPPTVFTSCKDKVRVDPADALPFKRDTLQFDPCLMFLEPQSEVCSWISGQGGVMVPGADVALPYLPPFVSSLNTLSALLRAKKSLTKSSLQLLSQGSKPRHPQTKPRPDTAGTPSRPPPDLPDSTSDLRLDGDQPASSFSSDLNSEEKDLVSSVRQLVAERFSDNPAYQQLKARFLSCFTVPALMATIRPTTKTTLAAPDSEEEEDEEVVELRKPKQREKRRKSKRTLLSDGPGAPATHFSGINTSLPEQTGPAGPETAPAVQ